MSAEHLLRGTKGLIQVAGIQDVEEARMLLEEGVHQIGFPLKLAVHKEDVSVEEAAGIIRSLKTPQCAVLITYLTDAREVLALCAELGVGKVQLHASIPVREVAKLRELAPHLSIWKSLVVGVGKFSLLQDSLHAFSPHVDAFITDTYDPETGACGATGKTHDWDASRRLVERSPLPVILAGGLNPENVRNAILHVRPAGVDVHTGVEDRGGRKKLELVRAFVSEAGEAFALVQGAPPKGR